MTISRKQILARPATSGQAVTFDSPAGAGMKLVMRAMARSIRELGDEDEGPAICPDWCRHAA
jgi:hypothetical protein